MDGWMDGWVDGWMDAHTRAHAQKYMKRQVEKWPMCSTPSYFLSALLVFQVGRVSQWGPDLCA
jgi:hypothetical protein